MRRGSVSQGDDNRPGQDESDSFWLASPSPGPRDDNNDGEDPNSESLSNLSAQLEAEKDARREERFVFFLIIVILLNVLLLGSMENWSAPLVVGAGEALLLVILANRWGLDEVVVIIDRLMSRVSGR